MPKELTFNYGLDDRKLLIEKREDGFCFTETIDGESYSVYVSLSEIATFSMQYRPRLNKAITDLLEFNQEQRA